MGKTVPLILHRPSTLTGWARTLDIGATFSGFDQSDTPAAADYRALSEDFAAVAGDFCEAVRIITPEP